MSASNKRTRDLAADKGADEIVEIDGAQARKRPRKTATTTVGHSENASNPNRSDECAPQLVDTHVILPARELTEPEPLPTQVFNSQLGTMMPLLLLPGLPSFVPLAWLSQARTMNGAVSAELPVQCRTSDVPTTKGKFSNAEDENIKATIEAYRLRGNLSHQDIEHKIFAKHQGRKTTFWHEIVAAAPGRTFNAVYSRVRRIYHPMRKQGPWITHEDEALLNAVNELGQQWEKVSLNVGRPPTDCRDRYRDYVKHRDLRTTGERKWTREEEDKLNQIVTAMLARKTDPQDGSDISWDRVSEKMNHTRGRKDCHMKWTQSMSKIMKNNGQIPRWKLQDTRILLQRMAMLQVQDETEINWGNLLDSEWSLWTARDLRRRWNIWKTDAKQIFPTMEYQEIINILRAQFDAPSVEDTTDNLPLVGSPSVGSGILFDQIQEDLQYQ